MSCCFFSSRFRANCWILWSCFKTYSIFYCFAIEMECNCCFLILFLASNWSFLIWAYSSLIWYLSLFSSWIYASFYNAYYILISLNSFLCMDLLKLSCLYFYKYWLAFLCFPSSFSLFSSIKSSCHSKRSYVSYLNFICSSFSLSSFCLAMAFLMAACSRATRSSFSCLASRMSFLDYIISASRL